MTHRERYEAACVAQDIPIVEVSKKTLTDLKKWDSIISRSKYQPRVKRAPVKRAPAVKRVPAVRAPRAAKPAVPVKPVLVWTVCKKCGLADAA